MIPAGRFGGNRMTRRLLCLGLIVAFGAPLRAQDVASPDLAAEPLSRCERRAQRNLSRLESVGDAASSVTRRIGRWRTGYLLLSGQTISADTAHVWGLIDEIL